jgi:NTE family protein
MSSPSAIVLSAGGARAAYQVGVLRRIAERAPDFQPTIFSGVSAGSINACFLAQGEPFAETTRRMEELWLELKSEDVFRTNFPSLSRAILRWVTDLFFARVTNRILLRSLLDATPLASTLGSRIPFAKVHRAIREGRVEGLSVTATDYRTGASVIFFDSTRKIPAWVRRHRQGIPGPVHLKHVLASCSLPVLFEPVKIGDRWYGDGSIRFSFPLSPAINMGAKRILAIGTQPHGTEAPAAEAATMGYVAGAVLHCLFQDSLETDIELLETINAAAPEKHIATAVLRPSIDPARLASEHLGELPFHFRQLLRTTAKRGDLGGLASYLLFSKPYLSALIELGRTDVDASWHDLAPLLQPAGGARAESLLEKS